MSSKESKAQIRRQLRKELLNDPRKCNNREDADHLLFNITYQIEELMPHAVFPAHSASAKPFVCENLLNYPECLVSTPRPIYIARKHADLNDRCHRRTMNKRKYLFQFQKYLTSSRHTCASKHSKKFEKQHIYPTGVFEVAERYEKRPDPYFNGCYDYFYAGGSLCILDDSSQHVVHVDEIHLNRLRVDRFPRRKKEEISKSSLCLGFTHDLNIDEEIYEVRPLLNPSRDDPTSSWFVARQENAITLLALDNNDNEEAVTSKTLFKSKNTPFISCAQSPDYVQEFLVSTVKQNVRLYDISTGAITVQNSFKITSDPTDKLTYPGLFTWNCVRPWKEKLFLYANRKQCCLMDLRTKPEDWLSQHACSFHVRDMFCDIITSLAPSHLANNLFYVGTQHKLYCLDVRFMGQGRSYLSGSNTLACWTHQLDYPPIHMDVYCKKRQEFIAIASPIADDMRICQLTKTKNLEGKTLDGINMQPDKYSYYPPTLAWQPPTLREAYEKATLSGKCLRPEIDMRNRIRCSTTGLAFYVPAPMQSTGDRQVQRPEALLLYTTSNGDVYSQSVQARQSQDYEERTNEETVDIMSEYSEKISELTQPDPKHSNNADFKCLSQMLFCKQLSDLDQKNLMYEDEVEQSEKKSLRLSKKRFHGGWTRSIASLHNFKDALAKGLLSNWDIDANEDEQKFSMSQIEKKLKTETKDDYVSTWLSKNEDERNPPMIRIPIGNLNITDTSFIDQTMPTTQDFGEQLQSTQIDTTVALDVLEQSNKKSKTSKTKRKYVKGF